MSDRRSVRAQNLIAAAAALADRDQATPADLWPLVLAVPTAGEQQLARQCLEEVLAESDNPSLFRLAEEVSAAQKVRARRFLEVGQEMLTAPEPLRVEGLLRDIDAHFAPDQLPLELAQLRAQLKATLP